MAQWPSSWRESLLRASGIPKTQFALDVLAAWQKSTPLESYSNNPLGMPRSSRSVPSWQDTEYAAYPTMQHFYAAFKRLVSTGQGRAILHVLIAADDHAATWREIHALNWPATKTEQDYPHLVLDMVEQKYRDRLTSRRTGDSKGTGIVTAHPSVHSNVRAQAAALYEVAQKFDDAGSAFEYIARRLS